jgi:hypothetical protein
MSDIYSNDPTPLISEKQQQELAASLDSAGSAVPLRPSDLHSRFVRCGRAWTWH